MLTLTAQGAGYYRVRVDGEAVSQHVAEREAVEAAVRAAREHPGARVTYTHEYEVLVELAAAAPEKPAPEPEEPEPEPEEPAPAPDPGTREPDIEEAFAYGATAQLLASPLYARSEDINTGRIALDTSVRYDGHPTMRYTYPERPGKTEYTVSRTLDLRPAGDIKEVWVEAVVRFDPHFTLDGGVPDYGRALKLLHVGIYGAAGRFGLNFENGDGGQLNAEGPNDNYDALYLRGAVRPRDLFDSRWHVIRYHVRLGSPALHEFWVDGVYQGQRTGSTSATRLWAIALCRNLNQGPPREQSLWWGRVRVWFADPVWTPEG